MARRPEKRAGAFRTIREVADWLGVPTHVLRFWESKFDQVSPTKGAGGRRYYRPDDMQLLGGIKVLLHDQGQTIRGVVQKIQEEGIEAVAALSPELDNEDSAPRTRKVIRKTPAPADEAAQEAGLPEEDNASGAGADALAEEMPEVPTDAPGDLDLPVPDDVEMPSDATSEAEDVEEGLIVDKDYSELDDRGAPNAEAPLDNAIDTAPSNDTAGDLAEQTALPLDGQPVSEAPLETPSDPPLIGETTEIELSEMAADRAQDETIDGSVPSYEALALVRSATGVRDPRRLRRLARRLAALADEIEDELSA